MVTHRNILLVKGNYGRVGGPETLLAALLRNLNRDLFFPIFVSLRKAGVAEAPILAQESARTEHREIWWPALWSAPFVAGVLARICRRYHAALVHSHDMRSSLVAYLLTRVRRIPWIAHVHGWLGPTHEQRGRLYERVEQKLVRYADLVLVGSYAARLEVEALGIAHVKVIPNAIEIPSSYEQRSLANQQLRTVLSYSSPSLLVGVVGRVHPGKGQAVFIRAVAELKKKGRNISALIVGEGPDLQHLQHLAQELGINDIVKFTGFLEDTRPQVAAMDIVVVPSLKESLPLTVLEAMSLSRPVIASQVGDLPRVIDSGENGILVPAGNPLALSEAITQLADDQALRERLGKNAYRTVTQKFSAAGMTKSLEGIYAELLAKEKY